MKLCTFTFKSVFIFLLISGHISEIKAQTTPTNTIEDTLRQKLNMDATYNRPIFKSNKYTMAIGGYIEANTHYSATDGVSEGLSFQMRRTTLFFSSTIASKLKFLSELEFEDGTKEINLEYAALDIELHPLLNLRGGIVMNPIGGFNQNHDGPRWDIIDRPISATSIIPSTLSNVGFGFHGKSFRKNNTLGYEFYLTNGFNDQIILNDENRTSLSASKTNRTRFEESSNGVPMMTAKVACRNRKLGEIGLSYMHSTYNTFEADGLILDQRRKLNLIALDFNFSFFKQKLNISGELAKLKVDVPDTYIQSFGEDQFGGYIDLVYTLFQKPMKSMDWHNSKINAVLRLDFADYNQGTFIETKTKIYDHVWALVPGIAFRPVGTSVFRLNYRFSQQTDLLGNPPSKTNVIQMGFASYF